MGKSIEDFSSVFYPFLTQAQEKPAALLEALRFSLLEKARESVAVKQQFFAEHGQTILHASLAMARAFHRGQKLLVMGNGGSATDAQHIAVEFMHPVTVGRKALPALALTNDVAVVTAVANDVSFADVFVRQLIALGQSGDLLLGLSTSGNSQNLLHGFEVGKKLGLVTIGYTGHDGGKMARQAAAGIIDYLLVVPTSSIHRIQETHVALYHIMWDLVHELFHHQALLAGEAGMATSKVPEEANQHEIRR
jgi:D-sedoheptulose 7-phosphate isomerase